MPDDHQTTAFWRFRLPHWEVLDGCYFITIRLHNTLPQLLLDECTNAKTADNTNDSPAAERHYFFRMEKYLHYHCRRTELASPEIATLVQNSLFHYHKCGVWKLLSHAIMPNHIHFFVYLKGKNLYRSITDFKRYTATQCNRILNQKHKRFWQKDWFDHWSRSTQENEKIIRYIRNNPVKAGLVKTRQDWPFCS